MERIASQSSDPAVLTTFTQTLRQREGAGLQKKFFRPFGPLFGLKISGGRADPPGPLP